MYIVKTFQHYIHFNFNSLIIINLQVPKHDNVIIFYVNA